MTQISLKQASLIRKEKEWEKANESRAIFWKKVLAVFNASRSILELKKKEKPSPIADNSDLDEEISPLYLNFFEEALPLIEPVLRAKMMSEMDRHVLETTPKPTSKKEYN